MALINSPSNPRRNLIGFVLVEGCVGLWFVSAFFRVNI